MSYSSSSKGAGRFPRPRWTLVLAGLAALLAAGNLAAQQEVGGRVVDAATGQPVVSAQVVVLDSEVGTLTDNRGQFILGVNAASVTVRVVSLGYREATQTLEAGRLDHVIQLTVSAIALDEIVVTGTAGGQQARALGNVVGRVSAAEIQQLTPVTQVSDMLSANVPGVRIMRAGGEVGSGGIQRIRGASSVSLGGAPLVYVDGVRVSGGNGVTGVGSVAFQGRAAPSPINDIPPEMIESVEVIKGPAAATLYGTEASNGVINIITKQGAVGQPRIDMRLRHGAYWLPDPVNFFPATYYRCSGVSQEANVDPRLKCNRGDVVEVRVLQVERDIHGNNWFRTGTLPGVGADVSGGAGTLRYFFSADWDREEGYVSYNFRERIGGRANVSFQPSDQLSVDFNLGTVRSTAQSASPQQPITTSILWGCPSPTCEPGSGASSALDGTLRGFIGYLPDRFEEDIEGFQHVDRSTGGLTFTHRPTDWFTHRLVFGGDFSNLRDTRLFRSGRKPGMTNQDGLRDVGNTRTTYQSVDYGASLPWDFSQSVTLTTSAGAQFYRRMHEATLSRGTGFPLDVLETVSSGAVRTSDEEFWENRSFGLYFQEEVGWQNRFYVTGAIRGDDNSAFGENFSFVVYPKVSASWVLNEEPFLRDNERISTLRLRGAWGRAGTQPDVFDALRTYEPVTGYEGSAAITPENVGNPELKPEVGEELEIGLDASFFDDRVSMEFTHFRQRTFDALIRVPTLPSLGFPGFQFQNLGETRNNGIELALNGNVFRSPRASLNLGFTLASARNEIVTLGSEDFVIQNVTEGQYQVPGFPIGGIFAKRIVSADLVERPPLVGNNPQRNTATNLMCEGGERVPGTPFSRGGGAAVPCEDAPLVYWGQPLPVWSGSANANLTIGQNLTLYGLVDFIHGRTWINGDIRSAHHSFFNTRAVVEGNDPILLGYLALGAEGRPQPGIMSGDFAKLRTVSAQYRLPDEWATRFGASRMTLGLSADNLAILWMGAKENFGHPQIDPERSSLTGGQTPGISAIHQEGWPTGRRFTTTVRVSF